MISKKKCFLKKAMISKNGSINFQLVIITTILAIK